jgi:hypothetical protein
MGKLTLSQIRARSKDYFFSKNTMRFFKGSKYGVTYDKNSDTNFVVVQKDGHLAFYKFDDKTGDLNYTSDIPRPERKSKKLKEMS